MKKNVIVAYLMGNKKILILIFCAGVLAIFKFLRGGIVEELSGLEQEYDSRVRVIDDNIRETKNLKQHVIEIENHVNETKARLFDREARSDNVRYFYSFEEKPDFVFTSITQLPEEPDVFQKGRPNEMKIYSAIGYKLSMRGKYSEILKFMDAMYQDKPMIRISDFRVTHDPADSNVFWAFMQVFVMAQK